MATTKTISPIRNHQKCPSSLKSLLSLSSLSSLKSLSSLSSLASPPIPQHPPQKKSPLLRIFFIFPFQISPAGLSLLYMTSCIPTFGFTQRVAVLLSFFTFAACLLAADGAPGKHMIDAPADTVESAIKTLSRQTGVGILVAAKDIRSLRSKPVKGEYTALEALKIMLAGTGLVVMQDAESSVLTVRRENAPPAAKKNGLPANASAGASSGNNDHDPRSGHPAAAAPTTAPAQTITVTGRVYNVATGFYVSNAEVRVAGASAFVYTEDGGYYSISVPAGRVTLTASYTSTQTATVTLDATPGGKNTADFDLQPLIIGRADSRAAPTTTTTAAGAAPGGDEIVVLDRFIVTEDRSGQARALAIQRASMNAVTAIATDNFGELTQGAVGEFLKYMPGVTIDYSEDEASTVRVGGLDPKYAGFTLDGIEIASAHESTSRANRFEQMSITGIDTIEFHQTLLARMPANTPAGKFELKSRYAFDRKRPQLRFSLGYDGLADAIELGRAYMPDDRKHQRMYPGGQISWGGPFFNRRLGVDISVSRYANYRNNQQHRTNYTYRIPDPEINPGTQFVERNGNLEMVEGPGIPQLAWRDGPRIWASSAANLSFDWKITPNLIFSMRNSYTVVRNEYFNVEVRFTANDRIVASENYSGHSKSVDPESTLTHWIVNPLEPNSYDSWTHQSNSYRVVDTTSYLVSPRLTYKKGSIQLDVRGGRSYSRANYRDGDRGRFAAVVTQIGGMGWEAERSSTSSPVWTITQTAGSHWSEPDNWNRVSTNINSIYYYAPHYQVNTQTSGYVDLTHVRRIFGQPVTFMAGGGILESEYTRRRNEARLTYNGPDGRQLQTVIPYTQNYMYNMKLGGKAGNINEQGWRANDQNALWRIYEEHPEWFGEDTANNYVRAVTASRDLTERIQSAYIEATSRAGRFSFNAGMRFESTSTDVLVTRLRSDEDIADAMALATPEQIATGMFDTTTLEGRRYQYYDGERFPRRTNYNNVFLSGGFKYDFTKNLRFQLSASQSILRPDYENLAGNVAYMSAYASSIWIPNPALKPEKTSKIYAGLQWYLNPAGLLSLSAYRLDIDDLQIPNMQITREQAESQVGYPLRYAAIPSDDEAGGGDFDNVDDLGNIEDFLSSVVYRSTINAKGTRTVYGVTLEYNQQLTFLPGFLKGLSVFGSVTTSSMRNAEIDEEKIGRADKSANGGIRYRYGRFNVQLRATWQDDALYSITRPVSGRRWLDNDHVYRKARTIVDLSGGFRINKNLEAVFSVRNLTDSPSIWYSNIPERLHMYQVYGSTWNLAIRGTY